MQPRVRRGRQPKDIIQNRRSSINAISDTVYNFSIFLQKIKYISHYNSTAAKVKYYGFIVPLTATFCVEWKLAVIGLYEVLQLEQRF